MKKNLLLAAIVLVMGLAQPAWAQTTLNSTSQPGKAKVATKAPEKAYVELTTTNGKIVLELDQAKAPKTVSNFLTYVRDGHYDGTIFHRVIGNFMVQGGGFNGQMQEKPTREPIKNEANNGLKNLKYTVAMARTNDPHSASSQFFINTVDNPPLDFKDEQAGWGYAVFGKVIQGQKVVNAIAKVKTGRMGPHSDVPVKPVFIEKAVVLDGPPKK